MSKSQIKHRIIVTVSIFAVVCSFIILSSLILDLKTKYLIILNLFLLGLFVNIMFFFRWRTNLAGEKNKKALKESETKYRDLVESLLEGIGIVDEDENFTFANKAGNEIFGCYDGELEGKNLNEFTTEKEFNLILDKTSNKRSGKTDIYELEIIGLDKVRRTILVKTNPVLDENGLYRGAFGFFSDITEQKKYEAQREKIITELKSKVIDGKSVTNGFLPICASCHGIRDKENIWHPVADYLSKHTDIKFSHSICPECKEDIYGPGKNNKNQKREYNISE
ncbi:MAG: PAS domain S-box protein [Candidatus Delongbacteria bacterium]|jgi:PAS domain S-box-containing protein|nr:PAS domain S-box protein [Candidatus Delongbacteria bacterium]